MILGEIERPWSLINRKGIGGVLCPENISVTAMSEPIAGMQVWKEGDKLGDNCCVLGEVWSSLVRRERAMNNGNEVGRNMA